MLQQRLKEGEEAQRTADCLDITDVTISRLRDTALNLRPSVLDDLGLAPALYWYARRQSERASCRIDVRADLPALPKDVETAAFRITQEAVNNAVRHARPTAIDITAQLREDRLDLRIRDDGTGFQPEDPTAEHGGMGLLGMRERAALLGGALQVESRPGGGTLITATIPIDGAAR